MFDMESALDRAMHVFWRKGYVGASLSDLTKAMGINRPSLYAAFGNKESLFRTALARYAEGPAAYLRESLAEPTARGVVRLLLRRVVEVGTASCNPRGCLWVRGSLSCDDPDDCLAREMVARQAAYAKALRARFRRAVAEGDLPEGADPAALARFVVTMASGLSVQAALGATRGELRRAAEIALEKFPAR